MPIRMAIIQIKKDKKHWWGCRERGALNTAGGNANYYGHYSKQYRCFSKHKNRNMIWSSNAIPWHTFINGINYFGRVICRTPAFFETLFVITVMWDQPKCSSMDKCIRNNTHMHAHIHDHICIYMCALEN